MFVRTSKRPGISIAQEQGIFPGCQSGWRDVSVVGGEIAKRKKVKSDDALELSRAKCGRRKMPRLQAMRGAELVPPESARAIRIARIALHRSRNVSRVSRLHRRVSVQSNCGRMRPDRFALRKPVRFFHFQGGFVVWKRRLVRKRLRKGWRADFVPYVEE